MKSAFAVMPPNTIHNTPMYLPGKESLVASVVSLLVVRCSRFVVRCSSFAVRCSFDNSNYNYYQSISFTRSVIPSFTPPPVPRTDYGPSRFPWSLRPSPGYSRRHRPRPRPRHRHRHRPHWTTESGRSKTGPFYLHAQV